METPNSNKSKTLWKINEFKNPNILNILILDKRLIIKCPAIILAANRIANVKGRIKWLIISIITIKGAKYSGLPWGTKWAALFLKFFVHPIIKKDIQKVIPNPKVTNGWAVKVKIKGNKLNKFLTTK